MLNKKLIAIKIPEVSHGNSLVLSATRILFQLLSRQVSKKPTQMEKYYVDAISSLSSLLKMTDLESDRRIIGKMIGNVRKYALHNSYRVMMSLYLSEHLYHRQNMLLYGIHVEGVEPHLEVARKRRGFEGDTRYKQFEICFGDEKSRELELVPLRVVQRPLLATPYVYTKDGYITYHGHQLNIDVSAVRDAQKAKRYQGYYFPHYTSLTHGTEDAYYELRLNPINEGKCAGQCRFCERLGSMPTEQEMEGRYTMIPEVLVEVIVAQHPGSIEHVKYVKLITDSFGGEAKCLTYLLRLRQAFEKHGFKGKFCFVSHEVRSQEGINILKNQIGVASFDFTLEIFTRRRELMGGYKGIPIEEVCEILRRARRAGLEVISINYIKGMESIDEFRRGIEMLAAENLVDEIGHNIMVPFASFQERFLVPDAKDFEYYLEMRRILDRLGIRSHYPNAYEKGDVFALPGVSPDYNDELVDVVKQSPKGVVGL